ncbi:SMI1/KNR4 family protein [Belliella sp. DSM 111904]|uniref:SMI1/KNR4 family protein n=1 Tax=Belliella filtrata TaxID=2923435 RepID=A0ABS9UVB8_9BACT|nr:SMI1/KNR4 family protein [Belliella filtrata]MCH7407895.1 SMI1/KNR4 family protein [Belliella filtrata]
MSIFSIKYTSQIKLLQLADITFNSMTIADIPEHFYSNEGCDRFDKSAFRNILLEKLSLQFESNVLKLMIFTPKDQQSPSDSFAFLANQKIVAMHIPNSRNFKLWMDDIFKRSYKELEEDRADGIFERQPELNPNPQFLLELGRGNFSIKRANSGMLFDEKPYENTGAYLHKKAPAKYNQAALRNQKDQFIKPYTKPNREVVNAETLSLLFHQLVQAKNLLPNAPEGNQKLYDDPNWKLEDLTGNNQANGYKSVGVYTNPSWVPFYSTGGGNFYAIDYAPGVQGKSGQIIAFGSDEVRIRFIADSMEVFLQQLTL